MHTDINVFRVENEKQTNQKNNSKIIKTVSSKVNLIQCCCVTEIFHTWIFILASVQSNLKRKKQPLHLITPVERESRKTFANKRKQVNN